MRQLGDELAKRFNRIEDVVSGDRDVVSAVCRLMTEWGQALEDALASDNRNEADALAWHAKAQAARWAGAVVSNTAMNPHTRVTDPDVPQMEPQTEQHSEDESDPYRMDVNWHQQSDDVNEKMPHSQE
jgi:hypothetical protein